MSCWRANSVLLNWHWRIWTGGGFSLAHFLIGTVIVVLLVILGLAYLLSKAPKGDPFD